jgi:hypothetical protein
MFVDVHVRAYTSRCEWRNAVYTFTVTQMYLDVGVRSALRDSLRF